MSEATAELTPLSPAAMRAEMPIAERIAYFDHAAVAPVSGPGRDAMRRATDAATELGDTVWLDLDAEVERARESSARLIGADADEIALVPNTTMGINFVAEGIDWQAGDNVVILADEYPANVYCWLNQESRGVEVRRVETDAGRVDLDKLRAACDARTRVVSVSWVGYSNGARRDLDAIGQIAHDAGAWLCVDAIQGLGVFPLDVSNSPIDFLAADSHKWMLGPEGAGIAYFKKEHLDRLRPIGVGAGSVVGRYDYANIDFRLRPCAARFEGGSTNMVGMIGLGASVDFLLRWPQGKLAEAVLAISDLTCERLQAAGIPVLSDRTVEPGGFDPRSGILIVELPGRDPVEARKRCLEAGVALTCRYNRLRISPHGYTNTDDVDRLIDALA